LLNIALLGDHANLGLLKIGIGSQNTRISK